MKRKTSHKRKGIKRYIFLFIIILIIGIYLLRDESIENLIIYVEISNNNDYLDEVEITEDEEASTTVTTTYDTEDVLLNPGKGFVIRDSMDSSYDDVVNVVYYRLMWSDIEPEEGVYNWDIIDEVLEDCIKRRKKICIWCYGWRKLIKY